MRLVQRSQARSQSEYLGITSLDDTPVFNGTVGNLGNDEFLEAVSVNPVNEMEWLLTLTAFGFIGSLPKFCAL